MPSSPSLHARSNQVLELPDGTVYPALHRLLRAGLLASDWTVVNGRRRRVYRLTPNGRTALLEHRALRQGSPGPCRTSSRGAMAQPQLIDRYLAALKDNLGRP